MLDFLKGLFRWRRLSAVSKALEVEAGPLVRQISNAIAAIDQVHTDGALPILPVRSAVLAETYGYFRNVNGRAVEIVVNVLNPHVDLTMVHEVGHFLDCKGLDRMTPWASVHSPKLTRWRSAVKATEAVQRLGRLADPALLTTQEALWNGSVVEYVINKSYVEYLLQAEELWARSYSQFIATESRAPELLRQLEQERDRPASGIYYPKHWEEADFQPILAEMAAIFRDLRWM